jgi:ABC-type dipeptide/oligopeptide/nickel transport system permease subunit
VLAVFAPQIAPHHPNDDIFRGMRGVGPSWEHPMGFDHLSRDLLSASSSARASRCWWG